MRVIEASDGMCRIELTRRNLEVLLEKLDYNRGLSTGSSAPSECTIIKEDEAGVIFVKAVENEKHYDDRTAGVMLRNATGEMV